MNAIEKSALSRLDEFVTSRDKFQLVNEFGFIIYRLYICTHSLKLNPFFAKGEPILQNEPIRILYPFHRLLSNKKMHLLQVHFFVGMINEFMKGFEGGSRFAGAKRFALRNLYKARLDGKGRR